MCLIRNSHTLMAIKVIVLFTAAIFLLVSTAMAAESGDELLANLKLYETIDEAEKALDDPFIWGERTIAEHIDSEYK